MQCLCIFSSHDPVDSCSKSFTEPHQNLDSRRPLSPFYLREMSLAESEIRGELFLENVAAQLADPSSNRF